MAPPLVFFVTRLVMTPLNLSARAYHRILKLARTIADLVRASGRGIAVPAEADLELAISLSSNYSSLYPQAGVCKATQYMSQGTSIGATSNLLSEPQTILLTFPPSIW
jgi:hypothetical protein